MARLGRFPRTEIHGFRLEVKRRVHGPFRDDSRLTDQDNAQRNNVRIFGFLAFLLYGDIDAAFQHGSAVTVEGGARKHRAQIVAILPRLIDQTKAQRDIFKSVCVEHGGLRN